MLIGLGVSVVDMNGEGLLGFCCSSTDGAGVTKSLHVSLNMVLGFRLLLECLSADSTFSQLLPGIILDLFHPFLYFSLQGIIHVGIRDIIGGVGTWFSWP